jgi:hypothetical protein
LHCFCPLHCLQRCPLLGHPSVCLLLLLLLLLHLLLLLLHLLLLLRTRVLL